MVMQIFLVMWAVLCCLMGNTLLEAAVYLFSIIEQAARYDDIDDVRTIAAAGVSLDSKDSEGRTGYFSCS